MSTIVKVVCWIIVVVVIARILAAIAYAIASVSEAKQRRAYNDREWEQFSTGLRTMTANVKTWQV